MEGFKGRGGGGRGGSGSRSQKNNQTENNSLVSPGVGTALGAGGLAMISGSGNNEGCPLDDTSFFCRLNRFVSILSMIIYIIVAITMILYFFYMAYSLLLDFYKSKK